MLPDQFNEAPAIEDSSNNAALAGSTEVTAYCGGGVDVSPLGDWSAWSAPRIDRCASSEFLLCRKATGVGRIAGDCAAADSAVCSDDEELLVYNARGGVPANTTVSATPGNEKIRCCKASEVTSQYKLMQWTAHRLNVPIWEMLATVVPRV